MANSKAQLERKFETCKRINMSAGGLTKLIKRDPTFPRPIKFGKSRQAAVFFEIQAVNDWLKKQQEEN